MPALQLVAPQTTTSSFEPRYFLAVAGEGRTIARHDSNQSIFLQGDAADAVFYIQSGKVKLAALSKGGKEAVLAILEPGDFFGEGCLNGQAQRLATATAMTDCSILRLGKAAMNRALQDETKFSELFIAFLLHRSSRIEENLLDQMFNRSEKRLARALLLLAHFDQEGGPDPIAPISQETLAEMIGTTRSRVNFFINKFRRLGFIHDDGGMRVNSGLLDVMRHD
jgi:CRP/FNR family cyclic AMP-dependent transcriptional regulator